MSGGMGYSPLPAMIWEACRLADKLGDSGKDLRAHLERMRAYVCGESQVPPPEADTLRELKAIRRLLDRQFPGIQ